jgi:dephospho-CoA kinase
MLKVALTGGIATGKTHVMVRLREGGIPTIDADAIVHEAFKPGTAVAQAIALEFGPAILAADGSVERRRLASIVFADAPARLRLEGIVHPTVYEEIRKWFGTVEGPVGVASIPLLYETRHESDFDMVVVTSCTAGQQLQRVMDRGLSEDEARRRIAAQIPIEDKASRADLVIWTGGTKAETEEQVDKLLAKLGN